jgi:hypothetical protein
VRLPLAAGTTLLLLPALVVGAWGLLPGWWAIPVAALIAVPIHAWLRRREVTLPSVALSRRRLAVSALLLVAAIVQLSRVGVFVVDPERRGFAALPRADTWALYHACFTGYVEAARLAREGGANIYDSANYETTDGHTRRMGMLFVDEYEYPPPFLPLPAALSAATGHDVLRSRAFFFGLQAVVLVLAMTAAATRLAPREAVLTWLLIPGTLAAFQTIVGMQYGNFQSGAFALAMAGMLAATGAGAAIAGTAALAFAAASKLFPGLIVILLIGARRYRALAATAAWMIAFVLLSLALFGTKPYVDFVTYQLPAISTGSGFAWAGEYPMLIPTNYGVSGLVLKAGALGLDAATFPRAMKVASLYGIAVVGLALFSAWRLRESGEAGRQAGGPILWLALLNLASFRSPYVADAQATMGTLWLMSLLIACEEWRGRRLAFAAAAWIGWAIAFEGIAPHENSVPLLVFTFTAQIAALAFNAWAVLRALPRRRPAYAAVTTPAPGLPAPGTASAPA